MLTVQRTFRVQPPTERVFTYLSDFTHTEQWDPGTLSTTRTDSGPLGPHSRFHNVSEFMGRRTELDYELTRYEPVSHLTFTGTNRTVTATDDMGFADADTGTSITYRATFRFNGLARLTEPFLRRPLEKLADQTVERLRAIIDSL